MRDVEDRPAGRQYHWLPGLLLLLVAIIVAVGARTLSYVDGCLVDNAGKTLALMAGEIADQLDATLYERYGDIQVLGKTLRPSLRDPEAMTQRLLQFHTLYASYEWLAVTDARGRVVAATDPASIGLDRSRSDWFLAAQRTPGVHLTDVSRLDELVGASAVGFTAAITDADGRFAGTVTSRVALTKVEDIFRRTVDRFKAQHEPPLRVEWQFMTRKGDLITDSMLREEWKVNLGRLSLPSAMQISTANEPGYVEERHHRRNVDVITGYARTQGYLEFPGFQWGILVRVDREEILQPVDMLTRMLGFSLIGMIAPVLALLVWTITRLRAQWATTVRESRQFSATLDSVEDTVIMIDREGRIALVNPAAETLTGWSPHAATGQPWQSCLALRGATHDGQRALDELISDVLAQGSAKHLPANTTLVRLGGDVRPVEGSARPLLDERQRMAGIVLTLRDTSDRRQKEAALREAALKFQALVESAQDAIVIADEHGLIRSWNTAGTRLFGYAAEEIVGQPLTKLMPERYRHHHRAGFERARSSGGMGAGQRLEAEALRKDGQDFPVECTFSTWNGETAHYFCGIIRDRTKHVRNERRLALQYGLTRILSDASALEEAMPRICETVCRTLEMDLAILWLIDPATDALRCRLIWPPDHDFAEPFVRETTDRRFSKGVGLPGRAWATSKVAWISEVSADANFPRLASARQAGIGSAVAFPIHTHDQVLGVLECFTRDATVPDPILLDMLQGIGDQIGQFAERTHLETQLRQTQKLEAIGRLAGGVAHDFNNLLTVITGNTRFLREALPAEHPGHELAAEIAEASDRAAQLTAQLLAFSRKQQVQPILLDLSQRLTMLERLLVRMIGEDVTVAVVPGPPGSLIQANPTQLEQVILNLALNARDAMPRGGRLTIEASPVDIHEGKRCSHGTLTPGAYVRLRVTDTGAGMPADTLDHLFEPFFTTKGQGKGTGLGLAIVYGILQACQGVIDVTSQPQQGTGFTLYFPRAQGTTVKSEEPPDQSALRGGAETVLLVEDDRAVRSWLRKVLTRAGYRVLDTADGAQALQRSRAHSGPIHLLLTDMVMPELSGPDVAAQLTHELPTLRVLYMSGYSDHPVFRDPGAVYALLQKPFTPEQVLETIRTVLDAPQD